MWVVKVCILPLFRVCVWKYPVCQVSTSTRGAFASDDVSFLPVSLTNYTGLLDIQHTGAFAYLCPWYTRTRAPDKPRNTCKFSLLTTFFRFSRKMNPKVEHVMTGCQVNCNWDSKGKFLISSVVFRLLILQLRWPRIENNTFLKFSLKGPSRTPVNGLADPTGSADPSLKTADLDVSFQNLNWELQEYQGYHFL